VTKAWILRLLVFFCTIGILASLAWTGYRLSQVGIGSPEATPVLLVHFKISSFAGLFLLLPSMFLFEDVIKKRGDRE
jgi:hypothetical protein